MIGLKQLLLRPGLWLTAAAGCAVVLATVLGTSSVAVSQDQSAATPKDVIFARKVLMSTIGDNMDEIDSMLETGKVDFNEANHHGDTISILLMAFPHLFPPPSNEWKPGVDHDPGTDTFASPDIWTKFSDFYKRAQDASKAAYNVSRSRTEADFKKYGTELRAGCDGCHNLYMKPQ